MTGPSHKPEISFSAWMPIPRDYAIGYWYISPKDGRTVHAGPDRWMRAKYRMAASVIATGQEIVTAHGGTGDRRWQRLVTCTQTEADSFFQEAIDKGDFMLKGVYKRACAARLRRLDKEAAGP